MMTVRTKCKRKIKIYYNGDIQGYTIIKKLKAQLAENDDYKAGRISIDKIDDSGEKCVCVYCFSDCKRIPELTI